MHTESDQAEEATVVHCLLTGLVNTVCRYPRSVLALCLVLCGVSVFASSTMLQFHTQRSDLISPRKDYQERWRRYLAEFGDDDDMVVVVKGKDRPQMQQALDVLADKVGQQPSLFDRIFYKVDLRPLHDRALLFLSAEQIRQIQDNLKSMNQLLEPPIFAGLDPFFGWKSLTLRQLLSEAERRAAAGKGDKTLRPGDEQLLTQVNAICRTASAVLDDPAKYATPWQSILPQAPEQKDLMAEPQYFFSGDGTLAFLLVRPVKEQGSFTAAQKSVDGLRGIVAKVGTQFPGLEFGLTGLPVLENDEMVASQNDTNAASWLALAGVALLYLVVYRSIKYPLLTVVTLLVGTGWAMGWLTLTVGHLNILSSTFAVMLIGMGDYGVLWVTRYEQERGGGADVLTAMRATTLSVGPGILTAATTTALAFFAAMLADFQAVAELGWIAGSGIYLCAFSTFTVLPALLRLLDRRERPTPVVVPISTRATWLPGLMRRPRWVLGGALGLTAVLGVFACQLTYDHNLLHLQAHGLDSVKWEMTLIEHTEGASWHALSYTTTQEEALALKTRYEQLPGVSRVVTMASLVPLDQDRKLDQLRDIQYRLRRLPLRGATMPNALPSPEQLHARAARLQEALRPLETGAQTPLVAELRKSLQQLQERIAAVDGDTAAKRLQEFEQALTRDLAEDLYRLREVSTPAPITVADLPPSLRERYIGQSGKWLLRVFGKDCLWDYAPLLHFCEQIHTVDSEATGKPFSTLEGLRAMKHGFQAAAIYALVAMILVLLLDFRNLWHTVLALAPLAMGLIVSFGIMGLCGVALNPANMIALPLILGVGADNGVHIIHDYLSQRRRQHYSLSLAMGRGVMVAALTTILGFGTLMISHHRGLASLGFVLTSGVTCCMLTALVFLPVVLRLLSVREHQRADAEREAGRRHRIPA